MRDKPTWLYAIVRVVGTVFYKLFYRYKMRGIEHLPSDQNYLIYANHYHALDPVTVALCCRRREIRFMSKADLFQNKLFRFLLTQLHAFPVRRGEADMGAMRAAMQVLKDGRVLGIFPEGHRQADGVFKGVETGVAVLALKCGVPVIPVRISGKYRFRGQMRAVVGAPLKLDDLRAQKPDAETLEAVKERIFRGIEDLAPLSDF
ncbi:MAG: 1-acyl-sn-glycerol-3-phosphate acyltransferase [Oscillospiraceae bacterium]|jgi:1-acyl-sn-glycerol-3-phosphate acyltransferase|nr:1-acyl-sn-glycerol-3-phosphate acyltransferase [Oscillospiraceae bacterium]